MSANNGEVAANSSPQPASRPQRKLEAWLGLLSSEDEFFPPISRAILLGISKSKITKSFQHVKYFKWCNASDSKS